MKKIIYLFILANIHTIMGKDLQKTDPINICIDKILQSNHDDTKNVSQDEIEQAIHTLEQENETLQKTITQLKIDLAKMRTNQGGKGPIKPTFVQAAQKIIETIKNKNLQIYQNKVKIQMLQLTNPHLQLTPIIKKKQIIQAAVKNPTATPETKKKK